jgi:hypothetical protein
MSALETEAPDDFQTEKLRQHVCACLTQALDEIESLSEARYTFYGYVDSIIHAFLADERWVSIEAWKRMDDTGRKRVAAYKIKRAIFAVENLPAISANLIVAAENLNEAVFDPYWTSGDFPKTRRCRHSPRPVLN